MIMSARNLPTSKKCDGDEPNEDAHANNDTQHAEPDPNSNQRGWGIRRNPSGRCIQLAQSRLVLERNDEEGP